MSLSPEICPVLVYCSSTSWGGLEMNSIRYANWFAECGFPVTVACVAESPVEEAARRASLPVILVRRNSKSLPLRAGFQLSLKLKKQPPSVVWFRDKRDMAVLGWTKRIMSPGFRLVYHQAMQLGVAKKDAVHSWRFRNIDRWIALLDYLAVQVKTMTRFPEDRIRQIPLGQDPARFERKLPQAEARRNLGLPEEGFIVGNIGRIDVLKGQHLLIEAAHILHQQGVPIHVLIVGEPTRNEGTSYLDQLKHSRKAHGLEQFVHILPFQEDVLPCFRAMDIFALTSTGETFGNVTVEAMLSGTCVLGTNSSGTPELLDFGKAGALFEPGNTHDLTEQLRVLVQREELLQEKAQGGKERAHSFYSKAAVLKQMKAILLNED